MITGHTQIFAILADPVAHVRTPQAFNRLFAEARADRILIPLQVPPDGLGRAVDGLRQIGNLGGFVVTVPHKQAIMAHCDEITAQARLVGAVNAVRRHADGRLTGGSFDGVGFVDGLAGAGHDIAGRRVLQLGAGGAGSAIAFALAAAGAAELVLANRDRTRAEALAARVAAAFPGFAVRAGDADPGGFDIVVNATSLGLKPDDPLPLDPARIDPGCLVAEVIMEPAETALLAAARARGARIHPGRLMLEAQLDAIGRFIGAL